MCTKDKLNQIPNHKPTKMDIKLLQPKKLRQHSTLKSLNQFQNKTKSSLEKKKSLTSNSIKSIPSMTTMKYTSLNPTEKNPIVFPSSLMNMDPKKSKRSVLDSTQRDTASVSLKQIGTQSLLLSSRNLQTMNSLNFDQRKKKLSQRGILRWDSRSFPNKDKNDQKEMKRIKKKIKEKNSLQFIKNYKKTKGKEKSSLESASTTGSSKENASQRNTSRQDIFGTDIVKGGKQHKVTFSYKGNVKVVENWKELNKKNYEGSDLLDLLKDNGMREIKDQINMEKKRKRKQKQKKYCFW